MQQEGQGFVKQIYPTGVQVVFEGDSLITIAALSCKGDDTSPLGLIIHDTRVFLQDFSQQPSFSHVSRNANRAAHRLALAGIGRHQEEVWLEEPPGHLD